MRELVKNADWTLEQGDKPDVYVLKSNDGKTEFSIDRDKLLSLQGIIEAVK